MDASVSRLLQSLTVNTMIVKNKTLQKIYRIGKRRLDFPMTILLCLILIIIFFLVLQSCSDDSDAPVSETFKVHGTYLTDPCGETIVLKGVNKMSVFDNDDPYGTEYFPEIAKTKANSVRIVWKTVDGNNNPSSKAQLESLIQNCIEAKMIPIVEIHDATCDWTKLDMVIDYWMQPDMVTLVKKYEHALLVNIANEAGDEAVTGVEFVAKYKDAITKFRNAGIRAPLIIDAPDCGKNLELIVPLAAGLILHDPLHNLMFSAHPYWPALFGATPEFIKAQLKVAADAEVPLILGELCAYGAWPGEGADKTESCGPKGAVDYTTLLEEISKNNFGWLSWEWGPGNGFYEDDGTLIMLCPAMDMTTDGTYQSLVSIQPGDVNAWAKEVVITSPYGLQNTAQKTNYILNGFKCQ